MTHLLRPRQESDLDDDQAGELVVFALRPEWGSHWAKGALDWVDSGVWTDDVAVALRRAAQDKRLTQHDRHRAWKYVKHLPAPPTE